MTGDVSHHRLIARPPGLPGYAPSRWCAVCGKKTADKAVVHCSANDCPNIVHVSCLADETTFDCSEVSAQRIALGITAPVGYHDPTASNQHEEVVTNDTSSEGDALSGPPEGIDEDLLKLNPTELVSIIRNLQAELVKKNKALQLYSSFSNNIGGVRDQLTNVLSFIDKIAASHSSLEDHSVRSIAATARPSRIDDEWLDHVSSNQETQTWWTSTKPKPLLYNTSVLPPGPCPTVAETVLTATDTVQLNHSSVPEQPGLAPVSEHPGVAPVSEQTDQVQPAPTKQLPNPPNRSNIPLLRTSKSTNTAQPRKPKNTGAPPNWGLTSVNQRQGNTIRKQAPLFPSGAKPTPPTQYCNHCRRKGHSEVDCLRKKQCDYCSRKGHSVQECRTKLTEERQEQFFLKISTEQAQNNSNFLQSLSRLLTPSPLQPPAHNPAHNTTWTTPSGLLASTHHPSHTNPTSAQPLLNYAGGGAWGFGCQ